MISQRFNLFPFLQADNTRTHTQKGMTFVLLPNSE